MRTIGALAELTRPGPFDTRTIEFGGYVGVRDGDPFVTMAGERMHDRHLREASGIRAHPDARAAVWRGGSRSAWSGASSRAAKRRSSTRRPNARAVGLYERKGLVTVREVPVRVVSRAA